MADIVIPAKNFFEKEDIRLSYGHQYVSSMRKVHECNYGISEYEFTNTLLQAFGFEALESEEHYLNLWLEQCKKEGEYYTHPAYQAIPYADGFGEDGDEEFIFPDEFGDDFIKTKQFTRARKKSKKEVIIEDYWLLSSKAKKSLNTQFQRDNRVIMNTTLGFQEGEEVRVYSEYGENNFIVKLDEDMRDDSILINSNTIGVNFLTPSTISEEGDSACYQEVKVKVKRVDL